MFLTPCFVNIIQFFPATPLPDLQMISIDHLTVLLSAAYPFHEHASISVTCRIDNLPEHLPSRGVEFRQAGKEAGGKMRLEE